MESLEGGAIVTQVGRSLFAGHGAFAHAGDSGDVVTAVGNGGVSHVVVVSHESGLSENAGLLKVTVSDGT